MEICVQVNTQALWVQWKAADNIFMPSASVRWGGQLDGWCDLIAMSTAFSFCKLQDV